LRLGLLLLMMTLLLLLLLKVKTLHFRRHIPVRRGRERMLGALLLQVQRHRRRCRVP
jgi:hypothetical protein